MVGALELVVAALAALGAVAALVDAARDVAVGWWLTGLLAALEVVLVAQALVGVVLLAGTEREVSGPLFVGYLVGSLLILPVGFALFLAERSRWGAVVLAVACLAVAAMLARLDVIWVGGG